MNNDRLGAYIQRLSSVFYENAINKNAAPRIDHGAWSFHTREWSSTPISAYSESSELCQDPVRWLILESLCFQFDVDQYGSLFVQSISGYVSNKNKKLLEDRRYQVRRGPDMNHWLICCVVYQPRRTRHKRGTAAFFKWISNKGDLDMILFVPRV